MISNIREMTPHENLMQMLQNSHSAFNGNPLQSGDSDSGSMNGNDNEQIIPLLKCKRTRKRASTSNNLTIDQRAKKARNEGTSGIGRNNKVIEKRQIKEGCSNTCRFKCASKITFEDRKKAFSTFWELADRTKQWLCIIEWTNVQKYEDYDSEDYKVMNKKAFKHTYALPSKNENVKVCKKMFLDTLGISHQWVVTASKKWAESQSTGKINECAIGKHRNRTNQIPEELKNLARDHITSFPVMESHNCLENTQRKYLENGLSIATMYRLFVEERRRALDICFIHEQMYRAIFVKEYNYGFLNPNEDRCDKCGAFLNKSASKTTKNEEDYKIHLKNDKES
ncbi:uncharacterized protein LOC106648291 isoform X1 [Trichogramma pretiosum]|uniref:uncharacterized protein LOC106648291 isoform X1 n=2 Tax=Trichogramma pretiosum TaxID=7493 RepID=UPI0006C9E079|nr:uncharacterized protein LOC106648291 isoform X1 [Trichogramma pretiosum]